MSGECFDRNLQELIEAALDFYDHTTPTKQDAEEWCRRHNRLHDALQPFSNSPEWLAERHLDEALAALHPTPDERYDVLVAAQRLIDVGGRLVE